MNLAVCDDNIADRKQTERLLGRQSDRIFKETGERIFIDSYGNAEAFLQNPQMYHGLFIDMVDSNMTGIEVLQNLLDQRILKPIIMCSSKVDYKAQFIEAGMSADNVLFLNKPLKVSELTEVVDRIKELNKTVEHTIELRGKAETIYAKGDDIICAKQIKAELEVFLSDGRTIILLENIVNFYAECNCFPQMCPVNDNSFINIDHIKETKFRKVIMDNDMVFPVPFSYRNAIKKTEAYRKEYEQHQKSGGQ
ncbi:MAG: response regulator [Butyrivibrio sp.]|nr:response regulator [Butyrivibrio sp.]